MRPLRQVGVCVLFGLAACRAATRPSDAEIHRLAAKALQEEVSAPSPILLHPLLIRRGKRGSPGLEHATFNAFDSTSIAELIALGGPDFRVCSTNTAGACEVPPGAVALVLSELQDLRRNGVAVGVVVIDGRDGRPRQQYFLARVSARSDAWEVVELRPRWKR